MSRLNQPCVVLRFADGNTKNVYLSEGINTIGTSPAVHVRLDGDRYASKVHAMVIVEDGQVALREARSLNGVYLKVGKEPIRLQDGDELLIGATRITLKIGREEVNDESS